MMNWLKRKWWFRKNHESVSWAVLIIDMQNLFLKDISGPARKKLIANQIEIIRYCALYDIPVFVMGYKGYGAVNVSLMCEVKKVLRNDKAVKSSCDGFGSCDKLKPCLEKWGVNGLIIMGIYARACVYHTAKSAVDNGFMIASARDLVVDANGKSSGKIFKKKGLYFKDHRRLLKNIDLMRIASI